MNTGARLSLLALLAVGLAACGNNSSTPTTPTTSTSPTTATFASQLPVGGAASRVFTASQSGTVTATLKTAGTGSTLVGLGIGVPYGGLSGCTLTRTVRTTAGNTPQLTVPVDEGQYCLVVYDVGTLTTTIAFELTLVYP